MNDRNFESDIDNTSTTSRITRDLMTRERVLAATDTAVLMRGKLVKGGMDDARCDELVAHLLHHMTEEIQRDNYRDEERSARESSARKEDPSDAFPFTSAQFVEIDPRQIGDGSLSDILREVIRKQRRGEDYGD